MPTKKSGTIALFEKLDHAVDAVTKATAEQDTARLALNAADQILAQKTKQAEELRSELQAQISKVLPAPVVDLRVRTS